MLKEIIERQVVNKLEKEQKNNYSPIGVFDSGYGGLTVLKELKNTLPNYDFLYLGDNARAPYGTRSFDTVYHYTLQSVKQLFEMGCELVILACNTASAKALRTIQQKDLPLISSQKRVLGVIRPTTELIGNYSNTKSIGIFATSGTVASDSYKIEIQKFFPNLNVFQQACPMWVPLIENNEITGDGVNYFVKKYVNQLLSQSSEIDTIVLACTHYPILKSVIESHLPAHIKVISQGEIVANSLKDYLTRHSNLDDIISKHSDVKFYTTDSASLFDEHASLFFGSEVKSKQIQF